MSESKTKFAYVKRNGALCICKVKCAGDVSVELANGTKMVVRDAQFMSKPLCGDVTGDSGATLSVITADKIGTYDCCQACASIFMMEGHKNGEFL